jgi:oxygen-dependent protoporphyrinogen oxidase
VLDYLVDPFISTIFFGDPRKMGMHSAFPALVEWERMRGSVVRGAMHAYKGKRAANAKAPTAGPASNGSGVARVELYVTDALPSLGSFKQGMGVLVECLARKLGEDLRLGAKVESVEAYSGGDGGKRGWRIRLRGGDELSAATLVVAVPAYAAATLLGQSISRLSSVLAAIEHAPISVVSSAFDRKQVRHPLDGFGFMVPRREGLQTICTFWNSSIFPAQAREGTALITSFVAGQNDGGSTGISDDQFAQTVQAENAVILGINGAPIDRMVWKHPRALPQYNVGHAQRVKEIREALNELPGLLLAGNYLMGRSIGDCAETGFQAAELLHIRSQS